MSEASPSSGRPRRRKTGRSPSYPGIDLGVAIQRARAVYEQEQMHWAPISAIVAHWGYSNFAGGRASTTFAALKKFGLMEEQSNKGERLGRLTELAREILLAPEPESAIRQAALMPPIHQEMWDAYGLNLPSEASLKWTLMNDKQFTEPGAEDFIKQYRQTLAMALADADLETEAEEASERVAVQHQPGSLTQEPPAMVDTWETSNSRFPVQRAEPAAMSRITRHAIPLVGGKQVILEGEFPLTEKAWEGFMTVLQAFKPGLVEEREDNQGHLGRRTAEPEEPAS